MCQTLFILDDEVPDDGLDELNIKVYEVDDMYIRKWGHRNCTSLKMHPKRKSLAIKSKSFTDAFLASTFGTFNEGMLSLRVIRPTQPSRFDKVDPTIVFYANTQVRWDYPFNGFCNYAITPM